MNLPRPFVLNALFVFLCLSPLAAHTQNAAPCPNPNAGRGGTPAERAARFQAAAETAANSIPPDPCLETYLERALPLISPQAPPPGGNQHAIELLRSALSNGEMAWGADSIKLVPFLTGLANQLDRPQLGASVPFDQGHLKEAESLLQRAVSITEKAYGPDDIHEAGLLSQLATIAVNEDGLSKGAVRSEALLERDLAIEEKAYGPDDFRITGTLWRLAVEYSNEQIACNMPYSGHPLTPQESQDCTAKALQKSDAVLLRDVQIIKTSPGPPNGGVNRSVDLPLQTLAQNYLRERNYAGAEDAYRQIVGIDTQAGASAGEQLVTDYNSLANAYRNDKNYPAARESLLKALDIATQLPPPKDPLRMSQLAIVLRSLGYLSIQQQDVEGARSYFQQALDVVAKGRPDNDPLVIQTVYLIANAYLFSNHLDEAEPLYLRAISTMKKNPPATTESMSRLDQSNYLMALQNYAALLQRTNRDSEAEGVWIKLIDASANDPGAKLLYAGSLANYAGLLTRMGRLDEAQTELQRLIAVSENDPLLAANYTRALQSYADLLRQMNKPDEAAKIDAQLKAFQDKAAQTPAVTPLN